MTEDGTKVNGEKLRPPSRAERVKSWGILIGAIATLAGSATALVSTLGVDKLIARRHGEQNAQTKEAYEQLVASNTKLREALRKAFERIRALEEDVKDLEEDYKMSMWMRMVAGSGAGGSTTPPPSEPEPAPPMTDDVEALLADSPPAKPVAKKTIFGFFESETYDDDLELLEEAAPPDWEQVQVQAQEEARP